jgi:FdhD protein
VLGEDDVAVEEPLEIRVGGRSVAVVMRTPGHDDELAVGFLVSEGVVRAAGEVAEVRVYPHDGESGNVVDVRLADGVEVDFGRLSRHVYAASACGVCGKATLEAVLRQVDPLAPGAGGGVAADWLGGLPARLREAQRAFALTGGVHATGLFRAGGALLLVREDVGRHNALDKVVGALVWSGVAPGECVLACSGRLSFELVQKALAARVPVLAGLGAASSLAAGCARAGGLTLVGFLREDRMVVYAGEERVGGAVRPGA